MAPLVPRMHLFEIDDQQWFHPWLRGRVQAALTIMWTFKVPVLQTISPANLVAALLTKHVPNLSSWVVIDFCAGGGGPTPAIERSVNHSAPSTRPSPPVQFVLTDLHPHTEDWALAASRSPNLHFEPSPVDASAAARAMIDRHASSSPSSSGGGGARKKVLRLFNLAFHHFDDGLARAILRNTAETSDGFAIFELQDRTAGSLATCCLFGLGILLVAPLYAWRWRSPATLLFTYLLPVLPFVLVFDGWVSCLRTRTPEEIEVLLRTCGAEDADQWEMRSGRERHLWPTGYLSWVVCVKKEQKAS